MYSLYARDPAGLRYVAAMNCPPSGTVSGVGTGVGRSKPCGPSPEPRGPSDVRSPENMSRRAVVAAVANGRPPGRPSMPKRTDGGRSVLLGPGLLGLRLLGLDVTSMIFGSRPVGAMA